MDKYLDIRDFGRALITTGDLDPVYLVIQHMEWQPGQLEQWCFGYWLFYHVGVASYLAEVPEAQFWGHVTYSKDWPRGTERRHFRGEAVHKAMNRFSHEYSGPAEAIQLLKDEFTTPEAPVAGVRAHVKRHWPMFGEWSSFKVADMLDAVLQYPVNFQLSEPDFFDSPKQAAVEVFQKWYPLTTDKSEDSMIYSVVNAIRNTLLDLRCPHAPHRPNNVQEIETILCKWKSHLNGHYPMGKDSRELKHVLAHSNWGPLATRFKEAAEQCLQF